MSDRPPADLYAAAANAALANAQRAGLVWRLIPGTVTGNGITGVTVTIDGDDQSITAQSLIGSLHAGDRVMVMDVPPQGKYIIGWYGAPRQIFQANVQPVTFSASTTQTATITFDEEFPATPVVTCQPVSSSGSAVKSTVLVTAVSTTQFSIRVDLNAAASITVSIHWHASLPT